MRELHRGASSRMVRGNKEEHFRGDALALEVHALPMEQEALAWC